MTATETQVTVPAGFKVVKIERDGYTYRPTLDYMHYFESCGHAVTVYNPATRTDKVMYVSYENYTDAEFGTVDQTARQQWEAMCAERTEWTGWFYWMLKTVDELDLCPVGSVVEVFKGRKVPKGVYTVTQRFTNDYGPTSFLKDSAGTIHRYINPDNFRRHDLKNVRKQFVLSNCPEGHGETVWNFLFADSPTGEYSSDKLHILCDYIEDELIPGIPAEAGRWIRQRYCKA